MSSWILIEEFIDKNAEACTQFLLFYYKNTSAILFINMASCGLIPTYSLFKLYHQTDHLTKEKPIDTLFVQ